MQHRSLIDNTQIIHERALKSLGLETALTMLEVARDLDNKIIKIFDMSGYYHPFDNINSCGTPWCLWGHTAYRLGRTVAQGRAEADLLQARDTAIRRLFAGRNPSDPKLAARAIRRYVLEGADDPWGNS